MPDITEPRTELLKSFSNLSPTIFNERPGQKLMPEGNSFLAETFGGSYIIKSGNTEAGTEVVKEIAQKAGITPRISKDPIGRSTSAPLPGSIIISDAPNPDGTIAVLSAGDSTLAKMKLEATLMLGAKESHQEMAASGVISPTFASRS